MRIAYLSDLHLEFDAARNPENRELAPWINAALAPAQRADLVVLAGDVDQGVAGIATAEAISHHVGAPVVYVTGNHEAYGSDLAALLPRLRASAWETDGRVLFLESNTARFWFADRPLAVLGCTLWTDYAIAGNAVSAMHSAEQRMNDHKSIGWNGGVFLPEHALELHRRHRAWLTAQIGRLSAERPRPEIIVVTHHAPCRDAVGPRALDLAPSYASDLGAEIRAWEPLSWIHGHTHRRHTVKIGSSTVISAPRGYPAECTGDDYVCGVLEL
jgi:3',5'-cyclic AMP phosphodiesterase CpdA